MSRTLSPSRWVWSSEIGVTTATGASITFVASQVPPRPTSMTATSTGASANAAYAMAVVISKKESLNGWRESTSSAYGRSSV